jgi:hypothetical protein
MAWFLFCERTHLKIAEFFLGTCSKSQHLFRADRIVGIVCGRSCCNSEHPLGANWPYPQRGSATPQSGSSAHFEAGSDHLRISLADWRLANCRNGEKCNEKQMFFSHFGLTGECSAEHVPSRPDCCLFILVAKSAILPPCDSGSRSTELAQESERDLHDLHLICRRETHAPRDPVAQLRSRAIDGRNQSRAQRLWRRSGLRNPLPAWD